MPELVRIDALERVMLATWPALETWADRGWVARATAGVTGRANSLSVLQRGDDPEAGHRRLEQVERWYRDRGLTPLVRTTPLAVGWLPDALTARGYRPWPAPTAVMARPLPADAHGDTDAQDTAISVAETGDDDWWAATGRSADDRRVLEAAASKSTAATCFVSLRVDGTTVATGRAGLADGHVAVYSMQTAPGHRRRGHAARVLTALEAWGRASGAHTATLQVVLDNDVATGLYRRRGYEPVYEYGYLRAAG